MVYRLFSCCVLLITLNCTSEGVSLMEPQSSSALPLCSGTASWPDFSTIPSPTLMDGIGNSHLPISTNDELAQRWFDQGINHLHGFNHLEAYRAFQEAILLDPECAIAYWGIAMCQPGFGGNDTRRWDQAITQAVTLAAQQSLTAVENDLIEALYLTMMEGLNQAAPLWEQIVRKHFDQAPDALAFSGIMLRQLVQSNQQSNAVKILLESAMELYPDHIGLGHYYTHVMEVREDFLAAKLCAEKVALLAPSASHLVHMPGHIYFLEGEYAKAVNTFERAYDLDVNYHSESKVPYAANQNYMHNLHYLAVASSELGDKEKALQVAKRYANLKLHNNQSLDGGGLMLLYEGLILPAWVQLRFRDYAAASREVRFWLDHPSFGASHPMVRLYFKTILAYSEGMLALDNGDIEFAIERNGQLIQHLKDFSERRNTWPNGAELRSIHQVYDVMVLLSLQLQGWLDNIERNHSFDNRVWQEALALEQNLPYDEPPRLMYPVGENLMYLQLFRGDQEAAGAAAKLAFEERPNSPVIRRALSQKRNKL